MASHLLFIIAGGPLLSLELSIDRERGATGGVWRGPRPPPIANKQTIGGLTCCTFERAEDARESCDSCIRAEDEEGYLVSDFFWWGGYDLGVLLELCIWLLWVL